MCLWQRPQGPCAQHTFPLSAYGCLVSLRLHPLPWDLRLHELRATSWVPPPPVPAPGGRSALTVGPEDSRGLGRASPSRMKHRQGELCPAKRPLPLGSALSWPKCSEAPSEPTTPGVQARGPGPGGGPVWVWGSVTCSGLETIWGLQLKSRRDPRKQGSTRQWPALGCRDPQSPLQDQEPLSGTAQPCQPHGPGLIPRLSSKLPEGSIVGNACLEPSKPYDMAVSMAAMSPGVTWPILVSRGCCDK